MIRLLAIAALLLAAVPARAELNLCNRTSYVTDVAIGIERPPTISTRGWFHLDPGQCRRVIDEPLDASLFYIHARTSPVYGTPPQPRSEHAELCVGEQTFAIANARHCANPAPFTAIKPVDTDKGPSANLAEDAEYNDAQARLAGVQRLLVIAGYDATPIDGIAGARTTAALAKFIADRKLAADAASSPDFFAVLLNAAQNPQGFGFTWCNETQNAVMAALAVLESNTNVARGWYRIEPGACVRPDLRGTPTKVYSYAEAVDHDGRAIKRDSKPAAWGGDTLFCTRDGKFELSDHKDCAARGLNTAGFVAVDLAGQPAATIRFKDQ